MTNHFNAFDHSNQLTVATDCKGFSRLVSIKPTFLEVIVMIPKRLFRPNCASCLTTVPARST